jgi:pentatricopeptide repeat protein
MAFSAHAVHAEVSEEAQDQLANHPQRWGGTGLVIASITEFRAHNFTRRKQLYEAAARTSPLCLYVHYKMTNDGENFGTLQAANWDIAARHSCALTLVQPYSLNALTASANVHLRNGEFGTSLCGISLGMMTRPVRRFTGGRTMDQVQAITVGRGSHARALARMVLADPDAVKTRQQVAFDNLYELQNRYRGQNWAGLAGFGGPVSFYRTQVVEREIRGMDMNDVNNLLNFSYSTAGYWPEQAIGWAELADTIGVSNYGRFVGTQALLSAHAKLGQFEKVEERYHEMRGGRSGRPPFLDVFLLAGLTQGNNHAQVHKVIEAVEKHDTDEHADNNYFHFLWRRTLMMAGRHADVAEAPAPESQPFQLEDANAFSLLFHEARHRFESGEFKTIRDRTDPYLEFKVEAGMGVYLDAALLKALAIKLEGGDLGHDPKKQTLKVVEPEFVDVFLDSPRMIDCQVFDMLCGRRKLEAPSGGPGLLWHGATYGERTPAHMGSGIATITEMSARASFIVGVLAFLADDNKGAKAAFSVCVEFNQRNSHEYHVAEWLLAKHLKE